MLICLCCCAHPWRDNFLGEPLPSLTLFLRNQHASYSFLGVTYFPANKDFESFSLSTSLDTSLPVTCLRITVNMQREVSPLVVRVWIARFFSAHYTSIIWLLIFGFAVKPTILMPLSAEGGFTQRWHLSVCLSVRSSVGSLQQCHRCHFHVKKSPVTFMFAAGFTVAHKRATLVSFLLTSIHQLKKVIQQN